MMSGPNDEKMIEYYIREEVKKAVPDDRIKELIKECLKEIVPNNTIDAKDIYVCTYFDESGDKRIGLFHRKDVSYPIKGINYNYLYSIYTGIDSNYLGVFCISNDTEHSERWLDKGEGFNDGIYTVNCKMDSCLGNFDKFRQKWRRDNNITASYDATSTTKEEMTAVRDYIDSYFIQLTNKRSHINT